MGFMRGRGALRRTLGWLQNGSILLKNEIRIISFYFSPGGRQFDNHKGLINFVFWHLPQLQYQNPSVQLVTFKRMAPSPFIMAYLEDDSRVVIDCDSRTRTEIHDHVQHILGKSKDTLQREKELTEDKQNPAIFGPDENRYCICTIPGQVPCPGFKALPKEMTGKYKQKMKQ